MHLLLYYFDISGFTARHSFSAALAGNRVKAKHYFSRLIELAVSGDHRPEIEQARHYLTNN